MAGGVAALLAVEAALSVALPRAYAEERAGRGLLGEMPLASLFFSGAADQEGEGSSGGHGEEAAEEVVERVVER